MTAAGGDDGRATHPFVVRPAVVADGPGMLEVWLTHEGGDRAEALAGIEGEIGRAVAGQGRLVLVAVVDGNVIAYSRARLRDAAPPGRPDVPLGWWLTGSVVLPAWRRQGVGRALMNRRLELLAALTDQVHSTVAPSNHASLAWHHAHGFELLQQEFEGVGARPDVCVLFRRRLG